MLEPTVDKSTEGSSATRPIKIQTIIPIYEQAQIATIVCIFALHLGFERKASSVEIVIVNPFVSL